MPVKFDPDQDYLLQIQDLTISYHSGGQWSDVIRGVSIHIRHGQTFGIVGESGSGKTTLALGIMGYLPKNGVVSQGSIMFDDRNLADLDKRELRKLWGSQLAYVPQDPHSSLNPSLTIGEQLIEGLKFHSSSTRSTARQHGLEWLERVRIPDPVRIFESYPHQISGGMQQRVMIALAMSSNPLLLILDEPTSNIDVTTQAVLLDLIKDLVHDRDTTVIYVTHDLRIVTSISDHIAVLYAGELVEEAPAPKLTQTPLHPYTQGLFKCVPHVGVNKRHAQLHTIQGSIPLPNERPSGCIFRPRCPIAVQICTIAPPFFQADGDRHTRCHRWKEIAERKIDPFAAVPISAPSRGTAGNDPTILRVEDAKVRYDMTRSMLNRKKEKKGEKVRAIDGITLQISQGQTLGLVGESGSGKTTLARAIIGLIRNTEGKFYFNSSLLPTTLEKRDISRLREIQMIFQNPGEVLNPYFTIGKSIQRSVQTLQGMESKEAQKFVLDLLELVHLPANYVRRRPSELSGGELQRVAIARAFSSTPKLLLADEPTSALDASLQASILNLLAELQIEKGTAFLMISHDIAAVGYLADWIAVIYLGRLMEIAEAEDLFSLPHHPYSEALLSAIPSLLGESADPSIRLESELPDPANLLSGCPFHTRCPRLIGEICRTKVPPWQVTSSDKQIFCHIPPEALEEMQDHQIISNASEAMNSP